MKLILIAALAALPILAAEYEVPRKDLTETQQQRALKLQAQKNAADSFLEAAKNEYNRTLGPIVAEWNELMVEACEPLKVPEDKLAECKLDPNKKKGAKFGEVRWQPDPPAKPQPAAPPKSEPAPAVPPSESK